MNKLLMAILFLVIPLSAIAGKTDCIFPINTVKQVAPPNPATVAAYQWGSPGYDKDASSEYMQTLRILYKNGDHAVIQHKYCTVYRIEINYFRNRQADDLDAKAISILIAGLYAQYYAAPEKVIFTKPLAEIIATTFKQQGFDREKDFTYGLPNDAANYPHPQLSVDYLISYKPLDEYRTSGIYSSVTTLSMGLSAGGG